VTECLDRPSVLLRGGFDVAQDGADVNRLAVVTTVVFAKLLHDLRFTICELRVKHQNSVNRKFIG
jgi:hypothetical protein